MFDYVRKLFGYISEQPTAEQPTERKEELYDERESDSSLQGRTTRLHIGYLSKEEEREAWGMDVPSQKQGFVKDNTDVKHLQKDVPEPGEIQLKKFDLSRICSDSIIYIDGRRRAGKSVLAKDIMCNLSKRGVRYGKIFTPYGRYSLTYDPTYEDFFPYAFIEEYNDKVLDDMIIHQSRRIRRNGGKSDKNNTVVLLDGVMSNDLLRVSKPLQTLFVQGRCYNICGIITSRHPLSLPPQLRCNIDYAFLFKTTDDDSMLRKLWENYASIIPTFSMFKKIMDAVTINYPYNCLVIDHTSHSSELTDKVFYYDANIHDNGERFGSEEFWNAAESSQQSDTP